MTHSESTADDEAPDDEGEDLWPEVSAIIASLTPLQNEVWECAYLHEGLDSREIAKAISTWADDLCRCFIDLQRSISRTFFYDNWAEGIARVRLHPDGGGYYHDGVSIPALDVDYGDGWRSEYDDTPYGSESEEEPEDEADDTGDDDDDKEGADAWPSDAPEDTPEAKGWVYVEDLDVWLDPRDSNDGPLTVECPRCRAVVGFDCTTPSGRDLEWGEHHQARTDRWQRTVGAS